MHEGKTIEQLGAMVSKATEKHTPGPLSVGLVVKLAERDNHGAHGSRQAIEICDSTGETLAYVIDPLHVGLFAAAPGLLAALNKCIPLLQAAQRTELLNEALAATAKAGGAQ